MTKGWTAAATAVTLLACIVGLNAQGMTKGSISSQPNSAQWNPLSFSENPESSYVFSQWNSQGNSDQDPQAYPAQWSPTNLATASSGGVLHAQSNPWNPPVIRPDNPSSSQSGHQWTKPETKPTNPLPSQSGSQWSSSGTKPANPLPSQTGSQWSGSGTKPANPLPSQTGSQWSGSGTKPANPLPSQTGSQWSGSGTKPANPLPSQTGSQWSGSGTKPANPPNSQSGYQWTKPRSESANPIQPLQGQKKPMDPSTVKCDVATEVRVPCGAADISAAQCEAISCCFDGHSCYFANAVTVQCTKDGQFIIVVCRDSTRPRLDLESFSLLGTGQGCTFADSNSQFAIYQFPVTKCGSQVMEDDDAIVYENRLSSSYEVGVGPYGSITRDSQFELLFQCKYTASAVEPVIVEVVKVDSPIRPVAAVGPINVQLRLANGQCQSKGCNEEDAAYSSYYTEYPVSKVLRDPVYVEVQLMDKTDPLLVLRLGRCWVTTSPNPHTLPQWDILTDGCPYRDDRYLSAIVPIKPSAGLDYPSHYRRFFFKMFTFVDTSTLSPLSQQIYIHCSTDVCDAKPGHNCEPSCYRQRRDVDALVTENAEPKAVGTVGPILISKPDQ